MMKHLRQLRGWLMRLFGLFNRQRREREFAEELESHLALHIAENIRAGMSPEEARRRALIKLGGVTLTKELHREQRGLPMLETLGQDLRFGLRMLRKNPGFSLVAILTLALGIGANTAIFSVVNAVLLRPLPYHDSEALMQVGRAFNGNEQVSDLSPRKFVFLREQMQAFDALAATQSLGANLMLSDESQSEYIRGVSVTADFLRVLGVAPASGRGFTMVEDSPEGERVVILSDEFWRRRFGADQKLIGQTLRINQRVHTVVGILPQGFEYFGVQDVLLPSRLGRASENTGHNWTVIGRLKAAATPTQARAEAQQIFERFRAEHPNEVDSKEFFGVRRWRENLTGEVSRLLWILQGAVGCILLIACANLTNLQLTRAATRSKEIAIRLALGASGWRLSRQLLTESILLALLGGGAGLMLAIWGLNALLALLPADLLPRTGEIKMDARVLAFAVIVSLLTSLAASLAPSWQAWLTDVNRHLKEGSGQSGATAGRGRLRKSLVVAEIALALLLTIGAGLLLRTFANLRGVALGFEARNALTFELTAQGASYDTAAKINELYARAQTHLHALPGVKSVAVVNRLPLDRWFNLPYRLAGEKNKFSGSAEYRLISPDYFSAIKMARQRGRDFNEADTAGAEPVVIVNETFARKHFADAEPLGQLVAVCCNERGDLAARRIVGVVNATKQRDLSGAAPATVFIPLNQTVTSQRDLIKQVSFVVRTTGDPLALSAAIRHELRQLDAGLPLRNLRSLDQLRDRAVAPQRFNLSLLALFLLAAFTLTRWVNTLLFGVSATDPLTFAVITLMLTFVALLACWIPARRATKVDPIIALRHE
jgi:predicted permease